MRNANHDMEKRKVQADTGGTAVGGDMIACTIGISDATVKKIVDTNKAALKDKDELLIYKNKEIEELSKKFNVTDKAVVSFLRSIKEQQVLLEQYETKLQEITSHYLKLKAKLAELPPDASDEMKALYQQAEEALEAGEYSKADDLLAQAETLEDRDIEHRQLRSAVTRARRGDISMTQLRYREAASHFAAAATKFPSSYPYIRALCLSEQASAIYHEGKDKGDIQALCDAIAIYYQALALTPRERVPLQWATIQNDPGIALQTLGNREGGTERLEEAVAAYREALKENTRERVPLDWAMAQNNLGNALGALGARESGTERLEEAVATFHAALEEVIRQLPIPKYGENLLPILALITMILPCAPLFNSN